MAENNEASILEQHFYDSLQYAQAMVNEGETIDIGSGAGFPGIPLKILFFAIFFQIFFSPPSILSL